MKTYPPSSSLTIRQRIEQLMARRHVGANDVLVIVHDNSDGDGYRFEFYLNDWDSPFDTFREYKEMDYRLDAENRHADVLHLAFSPHRLTAERR